MVKSEPYTVDAVHQDEWWKPTSDIGINEERWVRAVEMRTGTLAGRNVTHHALASLEQYEPNADAAANASAALDSLMEWAIGKTLLTCIGPVPENFSEPGARSVGRSITTRSARQFAIMWNSAIFLYPKGYVPGSIAPDFSYSRPIGRTPIWTSRPTPSLRRRPSMYSNPPRGLKNFQPHMHLRGKAMSMEAILPNGEVRIQSAVNDFNFNWMNNYIYADDDAPVLPKGTVLRITAYYINTDKQKTNPDPNQWVGYGDRTIDEMGHAWVNVTNISDKDYADWLEKHKPAAARMARTVQ